MTINFKCTKCGGTDLEQVSQATIYATVESYRDGCVELGDSSTFFDDKDTHYACVSCDFHFDIEKLTKKK